MKSPCFRSCAEKRVGRPQSSDGLVATCIPEASVATGPLQRLSKRLAINAAIPILRDNTSSRPVRGLPMLILLPSRFLPVTYCLIAL
jgi:hypothetical protein